MDKAHSTPDERAVRYEPKDVPPLLPLWLACLIGGFLGLVFLGIALGFPLADRQPSRGPLPALPPAPRLEIAPIAERQRYELAKQQELNKSALAIDAAMQATARQGWGRPK